MKFHRVREVLKNLSGTFVFAVVERRKQRILKDQDFDAPASMPEIVEIVESDDEGMPGLADASDDEDNTSEADAPSAEAEVRPNAEAPGTTAAVEAPTPGADTRA